MIREDTIEGYLTQQARQRLRASVYKFVCPGENGMPDRLIAIPVPRRALGLTAFVEVKRPGEAPTRLQYRKLRRLQQKGQIAAWVSTKEEVDALLTTLVEIVLVHCP